MGRNMLQKMVVSGEPGIVSGILEDGSKAQGQNPRLVACGDVTYARYFFFQNIEQDVFIDAGKV